MSSSFLPPVKTFSGNWADWPILIDEQHQEFQKQFVHQQPEFLSKKLGINFILENGDWRQIKLRGNDN
mgnify:CR=1 FL=1